MTYGTPWWRQQKPLTYQPTGPPLPPSPSPPSGPSEDAKLVAEALNNVAQAIKELALEVRFKNE